MSAVRDHFVYAAFDAEGRVLYIGCTKKLDERKADHKYNSDWFHLATRFHLSGPFDYETGRRVESERLTLERPLYAFHPARRTLAAIHSRIAKRETARLVSSGVDVYDAIAPAAQLATDLTGYPGNRAPIHVTDDILRLAFRREREFTDALDKRAS